MSNLQFDTDCTIHVVHRYGALEVKDSRRHQPESESMVPSESEV